MTDINLALPGASKASLKSALVPLTSGEVLLGRATLPLNTAGDTAVTVDNLGPYLITRIIIYGATAAQNLYRGTLRTASSGGGTEIFNMNYGLTISGPGSAGSAIDAGSGIMNGAEQLFNQATVYANCSTPEGTDGTYKIDIYGIYCPPL
jgi:hypothetical protein